MEISICIDEQYKWSDVFVILHSPFGREHHSVTTQPHESTVKEDFISL